MIKMWVLLVVLQQGSSQGGNSTIVAEFTSQDTCLHALNDTINQTNRGYIRVVSSGCYEK